MAIYLTGDTHGDFSRLGLYKLEPDSYLIILGDFGGVWDLQSGRSEMKRYRFLDNLPYTVLFIDGNHENFDRLLSDEFPEVDMFGDKVKKISDNVFYLQRGKVYNIEDKTFFCMGGAASIDKSWRKPHLSWWPQEDISSKEIDEAYNNLQKVDYKVDYILSHTVSESIVYEILKDSITSKSDIIKDVTSEFLEDLESKLEYDKNFFGHFHVPEIWTSDDNKHTCLFEQILKINA